MGIGESNCCEIYLLLSPKNISENILQMEEKEFLPTASASSCPASPKGKYMVYSLRLQRNRLGIL